MEMEFEVLGRVFVLNPSNLISQGSILIFLITFFLSFIFYHEVSKNIIFPLIFIVLSIFFAMRDERKEFISGIKKRVESGDTKSLYALAGIYEFERNFSELVNTYMKIIEKFPHDDIAYLRIAIILIHSGYFDLAVPLIKKAVEVNPENSEAKKMLEVIQKMEEMRKKQGEKKEGKEEKNQK